MNWDQIERNWQQMQDDVKEQWRELTHEQLALIAGKRDQLTGKLQAIYGIPITDAEDQVTDWQNNIVRRTRQSVSKSH
jgi:uncharacterized protein YjbJ (UPF0337 family)